MGGAKSFTIDIRRTKVTPHYLAVKSNIIPSIRKSTPRNSNNVPIFLESLNANMVVRLRLKARARSVSKVLGLSPNL